MDRGELGALGEQPGARFYAITAAGRRRLAAQTEDWERIAGVMARLLRLSPDP